MNTLSNTPGPCSVRDFEKKVDDLVRKFKSLKTEWLQNGYDETSMQAIESEVQEMTYEHDRLSNELDALPGKAHIPYPDDINKSEEQKSELNEAFSNLVKKYREFKEQVKLIWGVRGKK